MDNISAMPMAIINRVGKHLLLHHACTDWGSVDLAQNDAIDRLYYLHEVMCKLAKAQYQEGIVEWVLPRNLRPATYCVPSTNAYT